MALFDIRVLDSDAPSYLSKSPNKVLRDAENEKNGSMVQFVNTNTPHSPYYVQPSMD